MFRRQPGTTFLAVLTLSLGIGANAVIYSLLHAALIRPLPFPDADRLVAVVDNFVTEGQSTCRRRCRRCSTSAPPAARSIRFRSSTRATCRSTAARSRRAPSRRASKPDFLRTLGVQPALGRLFNAGDHQPGRDRVVILSDAFWRQNFGGDPTVIDRDHHRQRRPARRRSACCRPA